MSFRRVVLVALLAAALGIVGDLGTGARASGRASCGGATQLKGAPILQLGPLRMAGFASERCAWLKLGCGPTLGGYQAALSLELSHVSAAPIVLRAAQSDGVMFRLVGSDTPAPKVPRCLPGGAAHTRVSLRAPNTYFVLFVYARRGATVHVTATRRVRRLGTAVLVCRV